MKKETVSYDHLVVLASGECLTEQLPNDWPKWSNTKLDKFLAEHLWQPFEYWPIDEVWAEICQIADVMQNCIEKYDAVYTKENSYGS